jgi:hypothetical protein
MCGAIVKYCNKRLWADRFLWFYKFSQANATPRGKEGDMTTHILNRMTIKSLKAIAANTRKDEHWRNMAATLAAFGSGADVSEFVNTNGHRDAGVVLSAAQGAIGVIFMDSWGWLHESRASGAAGLDLEAFGPSGISRPLNKHHHHLGLDESDFVTINGGWPILVSPLPTRF